MLKVYQGFPLKLNYGENTVLVIRGQGLKYVVSGNGTVQGNITAEWIPGTYKYQVSNVSSIIETGQIEVIINYQLNDAEVKITTTNEDLLAAIQAQLAGRATAAQSSMSVGDKSISYCSLSELLQLREYFKNKVDTENGVHNIENGGKIKYKWSFR